MSERDILDRLFYFHDGYRRSDLSEGDAIALMIDADEEIRVLRARLEKAEAERDAARNDALEEAAMVATDLFSTERRDTGYCAYYGNVQLNIRSLKAPS